MPGAFDLACSRSHLLLGLTRSAAWSQSPGWGDLRQVTPAPLETSSYGCCEVVLVGKLVGNAYAYNYTSEFEKISVLDEF